LLFLAVCEAVEKNQRSAKELELRRFPITPLQLGQK
jgi:hypothetical protein